MSNPCREKILEAGCFEVLAHGEFIFASGARANNKMNFDRLYEPDNTLRIRYLLGKLGKIAARYSPDLLMGVISGGQRIAEEQSSLDYLGIPVARMKKAKNEPGIKTYTYATEADQDLVLAASRIIMFEDVANKLTSVRGALELPGVEERTVAVVSMWDRGNHPSREPLPSRIPHESLVTEHIPAHIKEFHPLYSSARIVAGP